MLKVTIKFTVPLFFLLLQSCKTADNSREAEEENRLRADSVSEARIDSAYVTISKNCDTLLVHEVPLMVELLKKKDTNAVRKLFDTVALYIDADKKVEKVIRQLKADCDANLLKETYRRLQPRPKPVPVRHKKAKA